MSFMEQRLLFLTANTLETATFSGSLDVKVLGHQRFSHRVGLGQDSCRHVTAFCCHLGAVLATQCVE